MNMPDEALKIQQKVQQQNSLLCSSPRFNALRLLLFFHYSPAHTHTHSPHTQSHTQRTNEIEKQRKDKRLIDVAVVQKKKKKNRSTEERRIKINKKKLN